MRWCRLGSGPLVRVRVGRMSIDIRNVSSGEFRSLLQDKKVLRVLFFGGFREIERAGQYSAVINHDHLVVGDGVLGINQHGNASIL